MFLGLFETKIDTINFFSIMSIIVLGDQGLRWTTTNQSKSCNIYTHTSMVSFKGRSNLKLL